MTADPDAWARQLVGRVLNGRYRLEGLLGVGGMGAVLAAEHVQVGKRVAVKMLLPDLAADAQAVRRFHQEARSAAAVGGRGVVDISDYDHDPSSGPYLVMELLRGESLAARIERLGKLEPGDTLWIARSLLRTLADVHTQGIVHRDLKPDNVFVALEEGEEVVKILDFGISRVMGESPARDSALLTRPGVVLGTPTYMAPEQARGQPDVDRRADLYAVGAILFECCAGRPPHVGASWQQVFAMVLTSPPPDLRTLRPNLPAALYDTVDRALLRDRSERFQDAASMLASLDGVGEPLPRTRAMEAGSVPRTRAHPATPVGNAWSESGGAAPVQAGPGTPYAVSATGPQRSGSGGCLVAAALVTGLLVAAGGVGTGLYLVAQDEEQTNLPGPIAQPTDDVQVGIEEETPTAEEDGGDAHPHAETGSDAGEPSSGESTAGSDRRRTGRRAASRTGSPGPMVTTTSMESDSQEAVAVPSTMAADAPPTGSSSAGGEVAGTLRARLQAANAARRAGRGREARRGYEDVVHLAWTAQVESGSPGARSAAEARLALGEMHAARVRPLPRAATPEEFQQGFRRVTNAYSEAAQQYTRVAMYGHTDLTQCGLFRTGQAAERLADVTGAIQAPQTLVDLGQEQAEQFESSFRDSANSYLEVARGVYESATSMPGTSPCRTQAMDAMQRVLRRLGRRAP